MRITPLDVRKQEFKRVVRGLDADEVYAFLATVADEYETVLTDNKQLREKVIDLDEKVSEYRNMERTLRDTLLTAERVMTEARQNAKKEADLILRDARLKADEQTANISGQVDSLKAELRELRGQRDSFLARMKGLSEAQLGLVDSYRRDFQRDDEAIDINYGSSRRVKGPIAPPTPIAQPQPVLPDVLPDMISQAETKPLAPLTADLDGEHDDFAPPMRPASTHTSEFSPADEWRSYQIGPRGAESEDEPLSDAARRERPREGSAQAGRQPEGPALASAVAEDDEASAVVEEALSGAVEPVPAASGGGWSLQRFTDGLKQDSGAE